jgi:hypothetical protein
MSALRSIMILCLLITASGFASDILGEYVGPLEYQGYLVFDYPEGEHPINNIVFNIDSTLAGNLIIVSVPSPWLYTYGDGILTLTSGSVEAGGSVWVTVSLNKYFDDGEYQVTSVGTSTTGEVSQAVGPLLVGDLILLNVIALASLYKYPLAAITIGIGFLDVFLSNRARTGKQIADAVAPMVTGASDDKSSKEDKPNLRTQHSMYPPGEEPPVFFRDYIGGDAGATDDGKKTSNSFYPDEVLSNLPRDMAKARANFEREILKDSPYGIAKSIGDVLLPETDNSGLPKTVDEPSKTIEDTGESKTEKTESGPSSTETELDDSDLPGLDTEPSTETELDDSDLPGLKTTISGEIKSEVPTIIGTTFYTDESIDASLYKLGLSTEDLKDLTDYKIDFNESPQEKTINEIKITPLISGEGKIQPDLIPKFTPKFSDTRTSISKIRPLHEGEPLKPILRQIIDIEGSQDGGPSQYRFFYKPIESYDGVNLVDLHGTPLIGTGEGGALIEFNPLHQTSLDNNIPFMTDFLVNKLHLSPESKSVETIILLDVKLTPIE